MSKPIPYAVNGDTSLYSLTSDQAFKFILNAPSGVKFAAYIDVCVYDEARKSTSRLTFVELNRPQAATLARRLLEAGGKQYKRLPLSIRSTSIPGQAKPRVTYWLG